MVGVGSLSTPVLHSVLADCGYPVLNFNGILECMYISSLHCYTALMLMLKWSKMERCCKNNKNFLNFRARRILFLVVASSTFPSITRDMWFFTRFSWSSRWWGSRNFSFPWRKKEIDEVFNLIISNKKWVAGEKSFSVQDNGENMVIGSFYIQIFDGNFSGKRKSNHCRFIW